MSNHNRFRALALAAAALGALSPATIRADGGSANLPPSVTLNGIIRDFREATVSGGHPDFELTPAGGFGHYVDLVQDTLDQDGRPVFKSTGHKVSTEWLDAQGRNIMEPRDYVSARSGDTTGASGSSDGGALNDRDHFAQWFRDTPGVNLSANIGITLNLDPQTGMYVYDDRNDPRLTGDGFFVINGQLYGNSAGDNRNFHFTYELDTLFTYQRGSGEVFTFDGDDDIWVFIDNKLVIDMGGVHGRLRQSIDLDRLTWLQDGQDYSLKVFYAERHRYSANFRMEAKLSNLRTVQLPVTSALAD